ncbi:oxygenase MpaB family protein [Hoyosella subflava]|uniref:ER-bound oxygenase mpaB/mpaB'/Rubber oxygenase catalytic domain-containing protein n=1 Tax=Hoyosella subflava (strain DSM 45089 / JCM 17490 / NBRC 109087 / DQS3-9A1) TaxID=443218 RepID=F6EF04_HOYSD|nr:oxygenase MpaB family protein [Hoyosella subflava]AEF42141.1 hypothetical protein AS9A_3703 [Hoyosella subflava DQS3-9A1]
MLSVLKRPVRKPSTTIAEELATDWRFLLLVGTGLLLQVCHPVIGAGVGQYSTYRTDPWGRFRRSVWPVLSMVVMGEQAGEYSRNLRALHRGIQGVDHTGRRYHAWDPEASWLVLASAVYASETAADLFGEPLTDSQREEVFRSWKRAGIAFGIPERALPANHAAHVAWLDEVAMRRLVNHPTARELLGVLRHPPAPPRVPGWLWAPIGYCVVGPLATFVTVGTLPPALRETLGADWTHADEVRLRAFASIVRRVDRLMPRQLRSVSGTIVRRNWASNQEYAAHGAAIGIAPSISNHYVEEQIDVAQ